MNGPLCWWSTKRGRWESAFGVPCDLPHPAPIASGWIEHAAPESTLFRRVGLWEGLP